VAQLPEFDAEWPEFPTLPIEAYLPTLSENGQDLFLKVIFFIFLLFVVKYK